MGFKVNNGHFTHIRKAMVSPRVEYSKINQKSEEKRPRNSRHIAIQELPTLIYCENCVQVLFLSGSPKRIE